MELMGRDIHVLPVKDLVPHDEHRDCWCSPRLLTVTHERTGTLKGLIVVHSSADGREAFEPAPPTIEVRH